MELLEDLLHLLKPLLVKLRLNQEVCSNVGHPDPAGISSLDSSLFAIATPTAVPSPNAGFSLSDYPACAVCPILADIKSLAYLYDFQGRMLKRSLRVDSLLFFSKCVMCL